MQPRDGLAGRGELTLGARREIVHPAVWRGRDVDRGSGGGGWRILFGTGAYAGMKGGGRPSATAPADLALGTVLVSHSGKASLGKRR